MKKKKPSILFTKKQPLLIRPWNNLIQIFNSVDGISGLHSISHHTAPGSLTGGPVVCVAEGARAVLGRLGPPAGEGAGPGQTEGGRVPVCPQRDAGQDPGHGEGECSYPCTSTVYIVQPSTVSIVTTQLPDQICERGCHSWFCGRMLGCGVGHIRICYFCCKSQTHTCGSYQPDLASLTNELKTNY